MREERYIYINDSSSQRVSFTNEISLDITEAQIPHLLQPSLTLRYSMYCFGSWKGDEATVTTALQMAHILQLL